MLLTIPLEMFCVDLYAHIVVGYVSLGVLKYVKHLRISGQWISESSLTITRGFHFVPIALKVPRLFYLRTLP